MDGTGGRIAFDSNGTIKIGNYDLSGHSKNPLYVGTTALSFSDGTLALKGDSGVDDLSYASGTLTIDTSAALASFWRIMVQA